MNYEKSFIITCEFMAAKVLILLFCATTIIIELCLAEESEDSTKLAVRASKAEINFAIEPEDVILKQGENATFRCQVVVSTEEKPQYLWKFNGEIVRKGSSDGTLVVNTGPAKKKKKGKEGGYQCFATTSFGLMISRLARLKIIDQSFVEKPPIAIDAWEGYNTRLSCEASPPEAKITWYAKNAPVATKDAKLMISEKNLYINNVQKSDAGQYRCQWKNSVSNGLAQVSFTVSVVEPPKTDIKLEFISPELPKNLTVLRSKEVSIHCHANKPNTAVRWSQVEAINRGGIMASTDLLRTSYRTLQFNETKEGEYAYMCIAETDTEKKLSKVVGFTVGEVPKVAGISESITSKMIGIPIRFQCNTTGFPEPSIRWFFNGEELDQNRNHRLAIKSNFMLVTDIQYADSGVYQCLVENVFGSTSSATVLDISTEGNLPPKVTDVQCIPINTTDIMVTFSYAPDPNAPPLKVEDGNAIFGTDVDSDSSSPMTKVVSDMFVVSYYREDDNSDHNTLLTGNGSVTVGKLRPDTRYSFVIKRYSGNQGSEPSETVTCSTKSSTASKLSQERIFYNAILLSWNKLNAVSFKVVAKNLNNPVKDVVERETNNDFVVLTNLTYGAQYEIEVFSHPRKTYEPILTTIKSTFTKSKFQFYKINESSVVFIWALIEKPETLIGFQIKLRKSGQQNIANEAFLLHSESSFIAHNLSPGESYEVSLYVVIGDDIGNETTEIDRLVFTTDHQTKPATLRPPSGTDCFVIKSGIRFVWFYPWDIDGPMYLAKFHARGSNDVLLKVTQEKNFIFPNLLGNKEYEMSVRVFSEKDESSNFTEPIMCKSLSTMPGKVYNISYSQTGSNSALLSWERPEKFDESEDQYIVSYGIHNRTTTERRAIGSEIPCINSTNIVVPPSVTSVEISKLDTNIEYVIMIRTENTKTKMGVDSPRRIIMLKSREEKNNETAIGLIIGGVIGTTFILICIISAVCGKKLLKTYYYRRNDSMRGISSYKKQDLKILTKNSTVFKNSAAYGNGTNLQSPLLSNGTFVNGGVQITNIEGVRYCPGSGIRAVKYEKDMLLNCDSPMDETYETIMEITDTERDHEGGDSGYCDKNHSQSPPMKDHSSRRQRKISDIPTDDGFHEASETYINGSSPV